MLEIPIKILIHFISIHDEFFYINYPSSFFLHRSYIPTHHFFFILPILPYQKIDKYKRKYRWNIFDGFYRQKYSLGIYRGTYNGKKNLNKAKKKTDNVPFLPTELPTVKSVGKLWTLFIMSITKWITDGIFRQNFPKCSRTVHLPIALLIVVLYGQNQRRIEKSSVLFGSFLKKFN